MAMPLDQPEAIVPLNETVEVSILGVRSAAETADGNPPKTVREKAEEMKRAAREIVKRLLGEQTEEEKCGAAPRSDKDQTYVDAKRAKRQRRLRRGM
jgi:hypothetical protein